jgi:uncharacterized membrane protein YdjX (TVP38/TMEM64 family)
MVRARNRLSLVAAGALLLSVGLGWYLLPVAAWLGALRDVVVDLGWIGVAVFAAVYVGAVVLLAPGSLLTIAAGFAYGFWGIPIALVAATAGAAIAFIVARHLARDSVRRAIETRRDIAALDRAIAAEGWKIVLLLRLSPLVPFNLQNYLFGITAVPFRSYVAATFVGMAPATSVFVLVGALGGAALDSGPGKWALLGGGLLATVAAVVLVTRKARALLREAGVNGRPAKGPQPRPRSGKIRRAQTPPRTPRTPRGRA